MTHKHSLFLRNKLNALRRKRLARVRQKVRGTSERPRLSVFRSNRHIYAQVIDDIHGKTLAQVSDLKLTKEKGATLCVRAAKVGEAIGKAAIEKKIKTVVFDRGGYRYHGVVKALADGARKSGLRF